MQTSVERLSLPRIPLDFLCEALELFGHVKELECTGIRDPQQVCMCTVRQPHEQTLKKANKKVSCKNIHKCRDGAASHSIVSK